MSRVPSAARAVQLRERFCDGHHRGGGAKLSAGKTKTPGVRLLGEARAVGAPWDLELGLRHCPRYANCALFTAVPQPIKTAVVRRRGVRERD
jgi:hypothetical protein